MHPDLVSDLICFNTQPPEGGWCPMSPVSEERYSFNTQPPEGGWGTPKRKHPRRTGFNTQPPEGGWDGQFTITKAEGEVSTHSRLKAAGEIYDTLSV